MITYKVPKQAGWYGSYLGDPVGSLLVDTMSEIIKRDRALKETIIGEIQLRGEYSDGLILESILTLIEQQEPIKKSRAGYTWEEESSEG